MKELKALIARLEAATEGSRELDARVYCERLGIEFDKMNDPASNSNDPLSFIFHVKGGQRYTCWGQDAVTRSLDAALTLVPEGYTWEVSSPMLLTDPERKPAAKGWPPERCGGPKPYGATPALAFTIAQMTRIDAAYGAAFPHPE